MQIKDQTESKSHNKPHHKNYKQGMFDKGQKKVLCRCPLCQEGENLHYVYMDWQGRPGVIPVKFCLAHMKSPDMYGNIEIHRCWE
jgi:hypothetical protein